MLRQSRSLASAFTNHQLFNSPWRMSLVLHRELTSISGIIDHINCAANEGKANLVLLTRETDATGLIHFTFFAV